MIPRHGYPYRTELLDLCTVPPYVVAHEQRLHIPLEALCIVDAG